MAQAMTTRQWITLMLSIRAKHYPDYPDDQGNRRVRGCYRDRARNYQEQSIKKKNYQGQKGTLGALGATNWGTVALVIPRFPLGKYVVF